MPRLAASALLLTLAAYGTSPPLPPPSLLDGPGSRIPPSLERVSDAQPRIEPQRVGGANKPYE
jgi:hypothetical protein